MLKKISWFNLIFLLVIVAVLCAINTIVDVFYQYYFETTFLPKNPNADFDLMFSQSRLDSDKNFLMGIWLFILCLQLIVIYQDLKLKSILEASLPNRKKMFSVFFAKIMVYAFMLISLPLNLIVFDKAYAAGLSMSDKLVLGFFICVMINSMAFIPYLAQTNIEKFFRLKDIVFFNLGMLATLIILIYIGVSQYLAPFIASMISGFPFISKIMASWHHVEEFFDIKGKRMNEMF